MMGIDFGHDGFTTTVFARADADGTITILDVQRAR